MAGTNRKKKISKPRIGVWVVLGLLILAGFLAWQYRKQLHSVAMMASSEVALAQHGEPTSASPSKSIADDKAGGTDAAVKLVGKLQIQKPPHDTQLGVVADDAVILFRKVEMYQWQEHCDGAGCGYDNAWSDRHIDSSKFRERAGHENPLAPFADARFAAGEVKLDELNVDPELILSQHPAIDYAVKANALPPNLAASFSVVDGVLYAGGDAAHPQVGTLRIRYRIVPGGEVSVSGVRRGTKLEAR